MSVMQLRKLVSDMLTNYGIWSTTLCMEICTTGVHHAGNELLDQIGDFAIIASILQCLAQPVITALVFHFWTAVSFI